MADFSQMSAAERAATIRDFVNQTYAAGGDNAAIAAAMDQYGVSPQEMASAMNTDVASVQAEYDRLSPTGAYRTAATSGGTTSNNLGITGLEQAAASLPNANAASGIANTNAAANVNAGAATPDFSQMSAADRAKTIQDFTNQTIAAYGDDVDGARRALAQAMDQYGVNVQEFASATGMSPTDVQSEYNRLNPNGTYFAEVPTPTTPTTPTTPLAPISPSAPVSGEGITTQIVREAPEIEAYKLGLLSQAQSLYNKGLDLPDYQVAAPAEGLLQSYDIAQKGLGAYQPFVFGGAQAIQQAQGLAGQAATMGQLGLGAYLSATGQYNPNQNIGQFMNPYQQLVTNEALREIRRQADIAGQGQAAQAVRAGAFGGTREGVQRAEMERNTQDIMSQRIAQDLAQNYSQALQAGQSAYEAQQGRALGAGQGIAGLTGTYGSLSGQLGQLGVQQAALGQALQQGVTSDVNMMNVLGGQQQQYAQSLIEAQRMSDLQSELAPYQQLGFVSDIYKGAPSTQSSVLTQSQQQTSPFMQVAGLGIAGLSAAAGAQKAGLFG